MSVSELFYTPDEVASMFRLTSSALTARRKRKTEPGSFAVKVGGRYLYPKDLVDAYLTNLARGARTETNETSVDQLPDPGPVG